MNIISKIILTIVFSVLGLFSCEKTIYIGSSQSTKMKNPRGNNISPEKALELSKPYLQKSWDLGCAKHNNREHWCVKRANRATVHIVQKGDYYFLRKTSYPYKATTAYLNHAVKVHVNSGEVIPPEK
jgi:hypothetical protein